ncbi:flavin reductase like domain-containing protein [Aspergillus desertorum]
MKLLYSRALLAASRSARSCRERGYIDISQSSPPLYPLQQYIRRTFITKPSLNPANPTPSSPTTTNNQHDDQSSLSTQIRLLMRRVPYPVAIITSTEPLPSTTPTPLSPTVNISFTSRFRGMTVSSFNTVTLTPHPVISFNVRRPSETLQALLSSGRFLVHLLATDQATASLARDFARGNQNLALGEGMFEFVGVAPSPASEAETEAVGTTEGPSMPPLPMLRMKGKDSMSCASEAKFGSFELVSSCFPFIFECQLLPESVVDVYDHTIVVGKIVRAITSASTSSTSGSVEIPPEDLCLTYANTKFWEMGKEVV